MEAQEVTFEWMFEEYLKHGISFVSKNRSETLRRWTYTRDGTSYVIIQQSAQTASPWAKLVSWVHNTNHMKLEVAQLKREASDILRRRLLSQNLKADGFIGVCLKSGKNPAKVVLYNQTMSHNVDIWAEARVIVEQNLGSEYLEAFNTLKKGS